jgi:hypothetical protein
MSVAFSRKSACLTQGLPYPGKFNEKDLDCFAVRKWERIWIHQCDERTNVDKYIFQCRSEALPLISPRTTFSSS